MKAKDLIKILQENPEVNVTVTVSGYDCDGVYGDGEVNTYDVVGIERNGTLELKYLKSVSLDTYLYEDEDYCTEN